MTSTTTHQGEEVAKVAAEHEHEDEHVHGPGCSHEHPHHHHQAQQPYVRDTVKIGRNDPCACGSGKKFKKCCAKN
jgi:uncharacterized protein YchJ